MRMRALVWAVVKIGKASVALTSRRLMQLGGVGHVIQGSLHRNYHQSALKNRTQIAGLSIQGHQKKRACYFRIITVSTITASISLNST